MNTQPGALGAKPRIVKATDYHPDSFAKAIPTPTTFSTAYPITYMQNQEPSCGEDMGTQYLNVLFGCIGSPMFGWKTLRQIDRLSPTDGSTSSGVALQAQTVGTTDLSLMPDNSTLSNADYASYTGITPEMLAQAKTRTIANYAFIDNPTFQQIKDNIFQHKAVGLRVNCGDGWWINGWAENEVCPLKLGTYVDDHFILAIGFDENYIYFSNSWSTAWGRNGEGYFDQSYIPYVKELVIFVPPVTLITPTPAKYIFTQTMMYGQTSADVHALQVKLGVTPTGYFGLITLIAVASFQKSHGLFPTGFVWGNTLTVLNSA